MSNLVVELLLKAKDLLSGTVRGSTSAVETFDAKTRAAAKGTEALGTASKKAGEDAQQGMSLAAREAGDLQKELARLSGQQQLINQFARLKTEAAETAKQLSASKSRTVELALAMKASNKPSRKMATDFERARKASRDLARRQREQAVSLQKLRGELAGAGINTKKLSEHNRELRNSSQAATARLNKLTSEIDRAGKQSKKSADQVEEFGDKTESAGRKTQSLNALLKSGVRQVLAYGAAFIGLNKLRQGLSAILSTGGRFEQLNIQLKQAMGSVAAGESAFAWIKQFTKDTPYQLDQVAEAFVKLKAFGLDPMDGTMQAIVDQSAKLGGSQETLNGIILAVGQAWAKQKLQGEEILQLVERGVPVWDLLSKATGRNTAELQKMSAAGKLGRTEIKLLIDAIGQSSQGAAADSMTIWSGLVSNMKDRWTEFFDSIARSGTLDYFKQQIIEAGAAAKRLAADGSLKRYAQNISDAITTTAQVVKASIAVVVKYSDALLALGKAFAIIKATQAAGVVVRFGAAMAGSVASVAGFGKATAQATGKVRGLGAAIKRIPTSIKIGVALVAFDLAVKTARVLGEAVARLTLDQDALREAQEKYNKAAYDGIISGQNLAAANYQYRDTVIQTAEAVAKMTEAERNSYAERLRGLADYERAQLRIALNEQLLGEDTTQRQQELGKSLQAVRAGFEAVEQGAAVAAEAVRNDLSPAAQLLVAEFDALMGKGGEVKTVLASLFKDFDPTSIESVRTYGEALLQLADDGRITADVITNQLAASLKDLSGQDLIRFQVTAEAAFGGVSESARELAGLLDGSLAAALQRLGVDVHELETGITTAGQDILDTFTAIAGNARASGEQIGAAFEAALKKLSTKEELTALKESLEKAFDAGRISATEALPAMAAVEKMLADVAKGAGEATDEFDRQAQTIKELRDELEKLRNQQENAKNDSEASAAAANEAANAWSAFWTNLRVSFYEMSDAVGEAYDRILEKSANMNDSMSGFLQDLSRQTQQLTSAYETQAGAYDTMIERVKGGTLSLYELNNAALTAAGGFTLLGDEQLAGLRAAIDDAQSKIDKLEESGQRTLDRLQDKLDRLQGNEAAIQQRDYERQRAELEKQLEQARKFGSRDATADLQRALQLLTQINSEEARRRQEKNRARELSRARADSTRTARQDVTINVNGVTDPETVARRIRPYLQKIDRLRA
ncbi:MAG TPA: hypothetical protein ENJ17_01350 [Gammaproteobacteria bacterium]|nr:hypothetical protein [Gammaproteobacteria bacterium]